MNFVIDYPENLIEPKGLHLPRLEDIQQAVDVARIVLGHFPHIEHEYDGEENADFFINVSDEVALINGKLADCSDMGEGFTTHPSTTGWNVASIFGLILFILLGQSEPDRT